MLAAFDLDGTISACPAVYAQWMLDLGNAGWRIVVLTGTGDTTPPTPAGWQEKVAKLAGLGCGKCWHELVLFPGDPAQLAEEKAGWCAANKPDLFVDNTKINAAAAVAAGVPLVLVPWASRV